MNKIHQIYAPQFQQNPHFCGSSNIAKTMPDSSKTYETCVSPFQVLSDLCEKLNNKLINFVLYYTGGIPFRHNYSYCTDPL